MLPYDKYDLYQVSCSKLNVLWNFGLGQSWALLRRFVILRFCRTKNFEVAKSKVANVLKKSEQAKARGQFSTTLNRNKDDLFFL